MEIAKDNRKLLMVANPKAGKCAVKGALLELISIFDKAGYTVTVHPTQRYGTTDFVKENAGLYDLIVCCGGDGTLNEVLAGVYMSKSKVPVGYIPMGSTNDFSSNIGLPKAPKAAANAILDGVIKSHDLGSINGQMFSYIAATGAFTGASYSAPQRMKNSLGHFAYILEGTKYLSKIKPFRLKAEFNGKCVAGDYIYASVSNTLSVAGIVKMKNDEVRFNDGVFELLLVKKPVTAKESAELITAILSNKLNSSCIKLYRTAKVRMTFDSPTTFSIDGERGESTPEVIIKNHKRAINLVVPRKKLI